MLESKDTSQRVAARLLEFFAAQTGWFRGLWEVGTVLSLRELLEAVDAVPAGILSEKAVEWLANELSKALGQDEGIAPPSRSLLQRLLGSPLKHRSGELPAVIRLTEQIDAAYLSRWAQRIALGMPVKPERLARAVASHLLDAGFSPDFLHRWLKYRLLHASQLQSLAELLEDAHALARSPPSDFRVLLTVNSALGTPGLPPSQWCDAPAVSKWLSTNGFDPTHVRQGGGWLLTIRCRDAYSAVERASETVEKLAARLLIGAGHQMRPGEHAYVEGVNHPLPLRRQRRVEVRSLERQAQLFEYGAPSRVDAAFELLGQLDAPAVVAVAAGWAAIEALLVAPGDGQKSPAGDRLASLVACSFPRAELTLLASLQGRNNDSPLRAQLRQCARGRDRAALMGNAIRQAQPLPWAEEDWSQKAAVARMDGLLKDPQKKLKDVEGYAVRAFRRLYRQRNLVLHGGKTDAVALRASLRTVAPLIGAGIDRIAHAWFGHGVQPLELAVKARHRLDLLEAREPLAMLDLLE
ncbi:hypothetical protein D7Y13_17325 [Corallococcus praedator]|uniref:Integrase n=1 Tax=Corallococcus praedator TaxID=2316724 RepID=A0ABX9QH15_9BACT|nr:MULTISPECIES: hypothetical protein [Corallococcus]RKH32346.1 hypothetical protein D7X75_16205 [Corallococcus sp. CA031C]RKI07737.1 hypothetical protein D7Y13_17325 [Corallococcus praedator]